MTGRFAAADQSGEDFSMAAVRLRDANRVRILLPDVFLSKDGTLRRMAVLEVHRLTADPCGFRNDHHALEWRVVEDGSTWDRALFRWLRGELERLKPKDWQFGPRPEDAAAAQIGGLARRASPDENETEVSWRSVEERPNVFTYPSMQKPFGVPRLGDESEADRLLREPNAESHTAAEPLPAASLLDAAFRKWSGDKEDRESFLGTPLIDDLRAEMERALRDWGGHGSGTTSDGGVNTAPAVRVISGRTCDSDDRRPKVLIVRSGSNERFAAVLTAAQDVPGWELIRVIQIGGLSSEEL